MNVETVVTIVSSVFASTIGVGVPAITGLFIIYGRLCKVEAYVHAISKQINNGKEGILA